MLVLGIESSCDETAAAIVNENRQILGQALLSQEEHKAFGGVVNILMKLLKPALNAPALNLKI